MRGGGGGRGKRSFTYTQNKGRGGGDEELSSILKLKEGHNRFLVSFNTGA